MDISKMSKAEIAAYISKLEEEKKALEAKASRAGKPSWGRCNPYELATGEKYPSEKAWVSPTGGQGSKVYGDLDYLRKLAAYLPEVIAAFEADQKANPQAYPTPEQIKAMKADRGEKNKARFAAYKASK